MQPEGGVACPVSGTGARQAQQAFSTRRPPPAAMLSGGFRANYFCTCSALPGALLPAFLAKLI